MPTPVTPQAQTRAFQIFSAMSPAAQQELWASLNRVLDRDPHGDMIRNRARALTMGLGDLEAALATGITALVTTAATVGLAVYDKRQQKSAQARQDDQAMQMALTQVKADQGQATINSHVFEYTMFGVSGVVALGIIVWGITRMRKPRR